MTNRRFTALFEYNLRTYFFNTMMLWFSASSFIHQKIRANTWELNFEHLNDSFTTCAFLCVFGIHSFSTTTNSSIKLNMHDSSFCSTKKNQNPQK